MQDLIRLGPRQAELINTRICDLPLALERSFVRPQVQGLYEDLDRVGLSQFRPHVYLGDEWFSPEGCNTISVPFYLINRQLRSLEKKFMKEVEGGSALTCRQLLRHESGHCFDHIYHVSRLPKWRQLFGDRSKRYQTARYRYDPTSTDYVNHLPDHYAQSHPDEDFAETFAVYISPEIPWRKIYLKESKAYQKLLYVEELIRTVRKRSHSIGYDNDGELLMCQASRKRMTLQRFYELRKAPTLLN